MRAHGLLLAAGAGRRMGQPKALVTDAEGMPWVQRGIAVLNGGGCDRVSVVIGAQADRVAPLVRAAGGDPVLAPDWERGMGHSLAAGLAAITGTDPLAEVAVLLLVDLPDVGAEVVTRVLHHWAHEIGDPRRGLVRATYTGTPGHPVLVGREHWSTVQTELAGDRGARDWLAERHVDLVECGDLATGCDVDRPTRPEGE